MRQLARSRAPIVIQINNRGPLMKMPNNNQPTAATPLPDLTTTPKWAEDMGRTLVTLWRWKNKGWIHPINISGRSYLTREDIEQFVRRAKAGEFQKEFHGAASRSMAKKASKGDAKQKAVVL